ncbi:CatB-related O-acetyltransferase [Candidatus Halocynthiibacter alkanivorans]|uniref:CatB-related O-acetyltransferase n=1 Tax=Candidatus Halocynthiibacter alkanivorans TaxID=2267619 RepID=UPI000DF13A9C|nr:CatB-related O-acetyltransferase [Candidatus Halocynthiibacter alkanivorans]
MSEAFLNAAVRHPVRLPDGTAVEGLVHLDQVIEHPNWSIGAHSYFSSFDPVTDYAAHLAPYLYPGAPERLVLGRFCALAHGVRFITSSANHPLGGFSTYPFAIMRPDTMGAYREEISRKGDTLVGNDVWIGHGAQILPGVTIGDGAIIAAGAVVSRDVAPYSVVAGNPARLVRMRFDSEVVAALLSIRWWDWPLAAIEAAESALAGADIKALRAAAPGNL